MNADTKYNQNMIIMLAETMYEISPWQSDRIFEIMKTCGNLNKSTGLKISPAYGPTRILLSSYSGRFNKRLTY